MSSYSSATTTVDTTGLDPSSGLGATIESMILYSGFSQQSLVGGFSAESLVPYTFGATPTPTTTDEAYFTVTSTLASTQSIFPTLIPGLKCDMSLESVDSSRAACGTFVNNSTLALMRSCCKGAPLVLYHGGCNVYCNAQDQTVSDLQQCIDNGEKGAGVGYICNRVDASASSLLPEETITASFATATSAGTASGMGTVRSTATRSRDSQARAFGLGVSLAASIVILTITLGTFMYSGY